MKMVHEHADLFKNARLMTTDQWADYMIYLNPSQKVFVDGRSDFYGPEVGNEYIHLMNGQWDWEKVMREVPLQRGAIAYRKFAFAAVEAAPGVARGGGRR